MFAAHDALLEVTRYGDDESDIATFEQSVGALGALRDVDEAVIIGVGERRYDGVGEAPAIERDERRGQALGIGIDCVAEQKELNQWNAQHHRESQAVAAHLDQFLGEDRPDARE